VLIRCTARLLGLLGRRSVSLADEPPGEDDWYANLLVIERRKCLLLTHAGTLFPIFVADVHKREIEALGALVAEQVAAALADERLPCDVLGPLDPAATRLAPTASRSVLGFMNDSALACRCAVDAVGGLEHVDLEALNRALRRRLHNRDGYRQPLDLVLDRLLA
jgi:hypothetical protein